MTKLNQTHGARRGLSKTAAASMTAIGQQHQGIDGTGSSAHQHDDSFDDTGTTAGCFAASIARS